MYFNNDGGGNAVRNADSACAAILGGRLNRGTLRTRSTAERARVAEWRHGHGRHSRSPAQQPATGNRAFRLAHRVSDTVNSCPPADWPQRWELRARRPSPTRATDPPTWVRVLGRVVLDQQAARLAAGRRQAAQNGNQNVRGWRAFTSRTRAVHGGGDRRSAGVTARVQADRGGLVDTVVDVELHPGLAHGHAARRGDRACRRPRSW